SLPDRDNGDPLLIDAKVWADSARAIRVAITATSPGPFRAVLLIVVDILSFFAITYCALAPNRADAAKLVSVCESAGVSVRQLVERLPDFASDPSVSRLHQLLGDALHYVKTTLTPPPRHQKQWIVMLKAARSVRDVHEQLTKHWIDR
ncbi:hypothetical protein HK405_000694, partial [Cladochytrium tenue]